MSSASPSMLRMNAFQPVSWDSSLAAVYLVGSTGLSVLHSLAPEACRLSCVQLATHGCLSKTQEIEQSLVNGPGRYKEARSAIQPTLCASSDNEEDTY